MYIERLTLENYKGFEHATFEFCRADGQHAGWHVLAGRNGAGKSSVLAAIALALRAKNYAYRLLPDFQGQLRSGTKLGRISVHLVRDPEVDGFDDGATFYRSQADDHDPYGWVASDDNDIDDPSQAEPPLRFQLGLTMSASRDGRVLAREEQSQDWWPSWADRGPWLASGGSGWMIAAYGPQRRLQGHSDRALEVMRENSGVASLVTLFYSNASLAEATVWLRELAHRGDRSPLSIAELLALLNDGLLPDGLKASRLDEDGLLLVEQAGIELPLERLSDGYRAVIALVFDLLYRLDVAYRKPVKEGLRYLMNRPGVVLIDEAETHLHPSWQRRLGFWLIEHFPNIQFIVTTHSPFICQAAANGSLIRLSPPGDSRASGPLDDDEFWTVVNGSPDEAMQTELFGLDRVISDDAEALRDTVAELEVKDLSEPLTEVERQRLEDSRERLPTRPRDELDGLKRFVEKLG